MKKVFIIYKFLPKYRVDFYQLLKKELFNYNIDLQLIYGQSNKTDALKGDETVIEWAQFVPNKRYYLGKTELLWQPCLKYLKGADLIIVQTENRLLLNYWLMIARRLSKLKVAFWGHVYNMQDDVNSLRNKIKLKTLYQTDWWFAYTNGVKQFLADRGFPANKITAVQNAIDTIGLKKYYAGITETETDVLKRKLGISGSNVGIYCGGMYPDKHLDFILECCHRIKAAVPDFHMLFIGAGVEAEKVKAAANEAEWIHYAGPKFGMDRVIYFKIASVQIMPGLVGLSILDSMAMESPIITAEHPYHSPEIEYLENGKTGLITKFDTLAYSEAVIDLLKTQKYLAFAEAGKLASERYTVEHMVSNFAGGIRKCLEAK
jgi:glycosyltransferase involved in cell wall biosynthesis